MAKCIVKLLKSLNMKESERILESLFFKQGVKECIVELNKRKSNDSCITQVGHLLGNKNEVYQVQVKVTRNQEEFLGDLDVVVIKK